MKEKLMKKPRLIVGCRARFLTLKEKPARRGPKYFHDEEHWRREYGGREVLLLERSGGSFSVMLLGKGVKKLKKKDPKTVTNRMAWVPEEDMVLIDCNFEANMDFIDWYQENEENFCGDCGVWRKDKDPCPNEDCPGNHEEDYEEDSE
jgi:hypothetical protein